MNFLPIEFGLPQGVRSRPGSGLQRIQARPLLSAESFQTFRQFLVNPAKSAIGEDGDNIPRAHFRRDQLHDRLRPSGTMQARLPRFWGFCAATTAKSKRSASGMASDLNTLATTTSSASARLFARSICSTLRRRVLDRGSRIAHKRAPGITGAQRRQGACDRGRMMGEVVNDGDAVDLGADFQPPLHALERSSARLQ